MEKQLAFIYHFDKLEDSRINRKKLYPLPEILLVVLCESICGTQSWRDFVIFGEEKLGYLRRFLPFKHGILDWYVTLGEDNSRVRKDNAPENMAMVRHIVLNLLRSAKGRFKKDISIKGLQKKLLGENAY